MLFMKILRVFPNFQETMLYSEHFVAKKLSKRGHSTTVLTTEYAPKALEPYIKEKTDLPTRDWYNLNRVGSFRLGDKPVFKDIKAIKKLLKNEKFDVWHLYGYGTFTSLQILYLRKLWGIKTPVILSDHSDSHSSSHGGAALKVFDFIFRLLMRPVKSSISEFMAPILECQQSVTNRFHLKGSKWNLVPLGFDEEMFYHRAEDRNKEEKLVIGFAGKVSAGKRVDYLIECLMKLDIRKDVKLMVVGMNEQNKEYNSKLKELADKADFDIEFRPLASPKELREFYNYIDLAVYPGGVSITTIEASACGTPLIMYRSTNNLEYRVEGGRGHLFSTEDELLNLLTDYYKQYKENGFDHEAIAKVTNDVSSWDSLSKNYLEIYKRQNQ